MVLVFGKPAAGLEGCPVYHAPTAFRLLQDFADRVRESCTAQVCLAAGPVAVLLTVLATAPEAITCCRASTQVSFQWNTPEKVHTYLPDRRSGAHTLPSPICPVLVVLL